jgi:MFS family permease
VCDQNIEEQNMAAAKIHKYGALTDEDTAINSSVVIHNTTATNNSSKTMAQNSNGDEQGDHHHHGSGMIHTATKCSSRGSIGNSSMNQQKEAFLTKQPQPSSSTAPPLSTVTSSSAPTSWLKQSFDDLKKQYDDSSKNKPPISKWTKIYAFCAALNSVNLGYDIGVSTNAGPLIMDHFNLSDLQLELFLGSINFWSIFGALLSPALTDRCGRRLTFATAAVGFITGVSIMATSHSFEQLLVGRFFVGLGVGVGEAIDPMYIAEIAPPHCRGELVSWAEAGVAVGVVLGFASSLLGVGWRAMLSLGALLPFVMIVLVIFVMPESPRWLVEKNMEPQARLVLAKIYPPEEEPILFTQIKDHDEDGDDNDARIDVADTAMSESSKKTGASASGTTTTNMNNIDKVISDIHDSLELEQAAASAVGWGAILRPSPAVRRMLIVGVGMAIIQQACGIDAIMFYLMFVIRQSGIQSDSGQNTALIGLGIVKLLFVFVGAKLFDRLGRRPLLFTSLLGCTVSLLVVSATFRSDTPTSKVVTIVALGFYLAFFSTGLGPGNWVVISEIFATSIRAKAMSVAIFPNRVTATIMASSFLTLANWLTWPGFFLLLSAICLLSAVFLYIYLPETKNKSLESMSKYFAEVTGDRSILDMEDHLRQVKEERRLQMNRAAEERANPESGGNIGGESAGGGAGGLMS